MTGVPGVILAGGQARRMGGGDKCLRVLAGRRLLDHVTARLAPQVTRLALNANGDPARFGGSGLEVLPDGVPGGCGPLAGVLAALDWAAAGGFAAVVTVPADTPFLPRDLVARLVAAGVPAVAAGRDGRGQVQRHPVVGLWPVALRDPLRAALEGGARRVGDWAQGAAVAVFEAAPVDPFFNVNTPADLALAEALACR